MIWLQEILCGHCEMYVAQRQSMYDAYETLAVSRQTLRPTNAM